MRGKVLWVYIMASPERILYVGVTNDLARRVSEHRSKQMESFTRAHDVTRLVYFEEIAGPLAAITREKQIKSWTRKKKIALIEAVNPDWNDLASHWHRLPRPSGSG